MNIKKMIMMFILTATTITIFPQCSAEASEIGGAMSITEMITYQERRRSVPDFSLDKTLQETQDLMTQRLEENGITFYDSYSSEYLTCLSSLSDSSLKIGKNESENAEISEFAGIFTGRIAPYVMVAMESKDYSQCDTLFSELLDRTYQSIKNENIHLLLNADQNKESAAKSPRASWSVSKANDYAKIWAMGRNMQFPSFSNDCTNFTSQIALIGGKEYRYNTNASGLSWWQERVNWSTAWSVAHQFMTYWSADGSTSVSSFATKTATQNWASAGTFLGYMKGNTYQITHCAYVNGKSNGQIYISQHTTDRYNAKFVDIDTSAYSSYVAFKFNY